MNNMNMQMLNNNASHIMMNQMNMNMNNQMQQMKQMQDMLNYMMKSNHQNQNPDSSSLSSQHGGIIFIIMI